ncbi:MAG: putative FAD-linked oxidoreductase [Alphaproteobacteria bacterium MarineAlpha9_Bin4]|nr:hydroxyacid dehydrogenase [Pelagibacterales bacterium]PPR24992.1 MAG: putative FAD-linked oxidoreductase [Alphaproteobacteria bacterium MarineAlpha9_Bin4]
MSNQIKILKEKLDKNIWFDEDYKIAPYLTEERGRYVGKSKLLLKPKTVLEVSKILKICHKNKISVVPQGGRTGLSGGTIPNPKKNEVIISMEKMNKVLSIDKDNFHIVAQSGCTLEDIKKSSEEKNLYFPLTLPSMKSCTIGGNISTNAGGSSVLKYGMTRDLVLGLEVVLPNGKILNCLREIKKDNRSYDLKHIFIGSEGTLGIITTAILKIFPQPKKIGIAMVAVKSIKKCIEFFNYLNSIFNENLTSFELNSRLGFKLIRNNYPEIPIPFDGKYPWYIIFELSFLKKIDIESEFEMVLKNAIEKNIILDAIRPQNILQSENLWKTREWLSYAQKKDGVSIKHDISLPISKIQFFLKEAAMLIKKILPNANILTFGHLADGNIHYNISDNSKLNKTNIKSYSKKINTIVFDLVYKYNGSFSAEHGIGIMKTEELIKYTTSEELFIKKQIKKLFDPKGIMNPGKVFRKYG